MCCVVFSFLFVLCVCVEFGFSFQRLMSVELICCVVVTPATAYCTKCHPNGPPKPKPAAQTAAGTDSKQSTTPVAAAASTIPKAGGGGGGAAATGKPTATLAPASTDTKSPTTAATASPLIPVPSASVGTSRGPILTASFPQNPESKVYGVMKPDIVFFGENLPHTFHSLVEADKHKVDLVLVMGSSLAVQPVASLITLIPAHVPCVLINREVVGQPSRFDVELLGNCDSVCDILAKQLGWILPTHVKDTRFPALAPTAATKPSTPAAAAAAGSSGGTTPATNGTGTGSGSAAAAAATAAAPPTAPPPFIAPGEYKFVSPNRYLFHGYTPPKDPSAKPTEFPFGDESSSSGDDDGSGSGSDGIDSGSGGGVGGGKSYQQMLTEQRIAQARANARVISDERTGSGMGLSQGSTVTDDDEAAETEMADAIFNARRTISRIRRGVTTSDDEASITAAKAKAATNKPTK